MPGKSEKTRPIGRVDRTMDIFRRAAHLYKRWTRGLCVIRHSIPQPGDSHISVPNCIYSTDIYRLPSIHEPPAEFFLFNLPFNFGHPNGRGMILIQHPLTATLSIPPKIAHTCTSCNKGTDTNQGDCRCKAILISRGIARPHHLRPNHT